MEPLLSVIIEHVFGVYDGNIEVLQISFNGDSNVLDVVGLNVFELFHKFFELMDRNGVVTDYDAELHDVGLRMNVVTKHPSSRDSKKWTVTTHGC